MTQDRELLNAYKEAQRAENMIKHRSEIMSRPRAEWHTNRREKLELKRESYKDLANIKEKFDNHGKKPQEAKGKNKNEKKRDKKIKAKERQANSKFSTDVETDQKAKKKEKMGKDRQEFKSTGKLQNPITAAAKGEKIEHEGYSGKKYAAQVTHKSFKGKRNSVGAKINNYRGERSLVKLKQNEQNKRINKK